MEYEIVGVEAFKDSTVVTPVLNGISDKKITEISRMVVEITFRRKIQYHVANTFLQVLYNTWNANDIYKWNLPRRSLL